MDTVKIAAGTSMYRDLTVYNDTAHTSPRDLTGATISFEVLDSPDGDLVYEGQASITTAADGTAAVGIASTQTNGASFSVLYGETTLTEADGTVSVVDSFKLVIEGRASN